MTDAELFTTIQARLPLLTDHQDGHGGLRSPRLASGHGGDTEGRVPFGIAQVTDSPDDGPDGARTPAGILAWAASWALSIADTRGERVNHPALTYLATVSEWAAGEWGDWESVTDEARTILSRLDRITGHADTTDPDHACPACGGQLTQATTDCGLTDWRTCTTCDAWYPDGDIIDATRHHTIVTTTDGQHWITRDQARALHSNVPAATIRKWIERGHINTNGARISLSDLNRMTARRTA